MTDDNGKKKLTPLQFIGIYVAFGVLILGVYYVQRVLSNRENPQTVTWSPKQWYKEQLKALKEPSFSEFKGTELGEAYRFVWLRTFHNPVAIRVEIGQDGTGTLYLKVCSGAGGYEPGRLKTNRVIKITEEQVEQLRRTVEANKFWEHASSMGLDGAQWIVEVKIGWYYHYADEWSPKEGPVRNIAQHLIELSGYETDTVY